MKGRTALPSQDSNLRFLTSSFETHSLEYYSWLGVGQLSCSYGPRASFPTVPREEWSLFCTGLSHQHVLDSSPDQSHLPLPLVVTDRPCHCRAINPDMGTSWQHRAGPHHGSRWHHQLLTSVPHYPRVSTSASLSSLFLFLFLFHFSTTFLLLLVVPRVSKCLRPSQERSQECYARLMHYGTGQGSSWTWSSPPPQAYSVSPV